MIDGTLVPGDKALLPPTDSDGIWLKRLGMSWNRVTDLSADGCFLDAGESGDVVKGGGE